VVVHDIGRDATERSRKCRLGRVAVRVIVADDVLPDLEAHYRVVVPRPSPSAPSVPPSDGRPGDDSAHAPVLAPVLV